VEGRFVPGLLVAGRVVFKRDTWLDTDERPGGRDAEGEPDRSWKEPAVAERDIGCWREGEGEEFFRKKAGSKLKTFALSTSPSPSLQQVSFLGLNKR